MSVLVVMFACASPEGDALPPPEEFRAVTELDRAAHWQAALAVTDSPDVAVGDFDGDGTPDRARLWIADDADGWVVVARLSSMPDPVRVTQQNGAPWSRLLRTIAPGTHRLHRYQGIGPGGPDTTAVVELTRDAINVGRLESEGMTWVWDPAARAFEAVGMY